MNFKLYVNELSDVLLSLQLTGKNQEIINVDKGLSNLTSMCFDLRRRKGTLFFIGNGASAMMASHFATDFCKNGGVKSIVFNDSSLLTAIGNDMTFEQCFALPLQRYGQRGDTLVTISSSGNSPNILSAIEYAQKSGIYCVTFSGMKENNRSRQMGDLNFYIPGMTYGMAESAHHVLLHCWFDLYMEEGEKNGF